MRFLIQRVKRAKVTVDGAVTGEIAAGLVVLIGIAATDTRAEADYLIDKVSHLRIFPDEQGKMNRSALDTGVGMLLVSQFTLYGDTRKGRRPSFDLAAPPDVARELYEYVVEEVRRRGMPVGTGVFQAHMEVELVNDGPITFLLEK